MNVHYSYSSKVEHCAYNVTIWVQLPVGIDYHGTILNGSTQSHCNFHRDMFFYKNYLKQRSWRVRTTANPKVVGSIPRITRLDFFSWKKIIASLTFAVRSFHLMVFYENTVNDLLRQCVFIVVIFCTADHGMLG